VPRLPHLLLTLALSLPAAPAFAGGAVACPDRLPKPISAPGEAGEACQKAIAKEGTKFLKTKTSALQKCMLKSAPGACPSAADVGKIEDSAQNAAEKIAKACGEDAAQAGLASAYASVADDAAISSCMLSQENAIADVLVLNATGVSTEDMPLVDENEQPLIDNKARGKCVAEASKTGIKLALDVLANASKCLDKQIKGGAAGDLAPVCVGSYAGGAVVPPSDAKTAEKLGKLIGKAQDKIAKKCGPGEGTWLPSVFACDGAETAGELAACLVCQGFHSAVSFAEQQYGENAAAFVEPGTGAIEAAVNAASAGDKLLIRSGEYRERATLEVQGLQLVGCGGATGARPRLVRPDTCVDPADCERGLFASDLDDLLFQSLEVVNWDGDGIFVANAERVTFRDIVGNGMRNSAYAVFPRDSNGILIETCNVRDIRDAGLYVGQSENVVVRFNRIETSVAGIEFENTAFGVGHNNFATGNTGGILVFKDGSLPVQLSNDHRVAHNVFDSNNGENYGSGNVAGVPEGTGMLVISNDDSVFEYNFVRNNNSFGIALTDQVVAEFGPPFSADYQTQNNRVRRNVATGNGGDTDDEAPFPADVALFITDPPGGHDNCFEGNLSDIPLVLLGSMNECM
jgi:parallel beta-helix repeat protein